MNDQTSHSFTAFVITFSPGCQDRRQPRATLPQGSPTPAPRFGQGHKAAFQLRYPFQRFAAHPARWNRALDQRFQRRISRFSPITHFWRFSVAAESYQVFRCGSGVSTRAPLICCWSGAPVLQTKTWSSQAPRGCARDRRPAAAPPGGWRPADPSPWRRAKWVLFPSRILPNSAC